MRFIPESGREAQGAGKALSAQNPLRMRVKRAEMTRNTSAQRPRTLGYNPRKSLFLLKTHRKEEKLTDVQVSTNSETG